MNKSLKLSDVKMASKIVIHSKRTIIVKVVEVRCGNIWYDWYVRAPVGKGWKPSSGESDISRGRSVMIYRQPLICK